MYGDAAAFFFSGHGDFTGDCSLVGEARSPAGEVSEHRDAVFCGGRRRVGGPSPLPRSTGPVSAIHASAGSYRSGDMSDLGVEVCQLHTILIAATKSVSRYDSGWEVDYAARQAPLSG